MQSCPAFLSYIAYPDRSSLYCFRRRQNYDGSCLLVPKFLYLEVSVKNSQLVKYCIFPCKDAGDFFIPVILKQYRSQDFFRNGQLPCYICRRRKGKMLPLHVMPLFCSLYSVRYGKALSKPADFCMV